jgi:diaminopimelate decarboxylase
LATAQREHKFGVWIGDAIAAYRGASKKPELNMIGMHCHVGSNISETKVISEMANEIFKLANEVKETVGLRLSKIDLGGGLGFPYEPSSPAMTTDDYASSVLKNNNVNLEKLGNPTLIFEPGRAIVADAGILLTTVNVLKHQGDIDWSIVDAGMSMFLRPALYGAKHQILLANRASDAYETYSVGGPCCESADVLAHDISLPKLMERDLLAVLDVGAYGFTMSSNYNGQARPAVVLVGESEGLLIRRRDTYEDMTAPEVIPPHLLK